MTSARLLALIGILGGFAGGVAVGIFLAGPPPSAESRLPSGNPNLHPQPARARETVPSVSEPTPTADPSASLSAAKRFWSYLNMADELDRQSTWLSMLKGLRREDAETIRQLLETMQRQGRYPTFEAEAFWLRWGMIDGSNALKYAESERQGDMPARVMRGWAQVDPEAARAWLKQNSDYSQLSSALGGFVAGYAQRDLDGATRYVLGKKNELGEPYVRPAGDLVAAAGRQRQFAGVAQWFEALPDSELKNAAFQYVLLQRDGGSLPADWVAREAGKPWATDRAISSFVGYYVVEERSKALELISHLPPSPATGQYLGVDEVFRRLVEMKDTRAAEQWFARTDLAPELQAQGKAAYERYLGIMKNR